MYYNLFILFSLIVSFMGCSGIRILSQYGEEQEIKEKILKEQESNFYRLEKALEDKEIVLGLSYKEFLRNYGGPQIVREYNGKKEVIYKPYTEPNCPRTVYLYFQDDKLIDWYIRK